MRVQVPSPKRSSRRGPSLECHEVDIVLAVRGGGDAAGLAASADEWAARALLNVPVPVIVGLGHVRDGPPFRRAGLAHAPGRRQQGASRNCGGLLPNRHGPPCAIGMSVRSATSRAIAVRARSRSSGDGATPSWRAHSRILRNAAAELSGFRHVVAHFVAARCWPSCTVLQRDLDRNVEAIRWDASAWPGREADRLRDLYRSVTIGCPRKPSIGSTPCPTVKSRPRLRSSTLFSQARAPTSSAPCWRMQKPCASDASCSRRQSELHAANDAVVQVLDTDRALDARLRARGPTRRRHPHQGSCSRLSGGHVLADL